MNNDRWYKRCPKAELEDVTGLSLEERGAYSTVLDLIYSSANQLRDDDRYIAGHLSVDVRVWRRLRVSLIARELIYVQDGFVHNERADLEVAECLRRIASVTESGRHGGLARARNVAARTSSTRALAQADAQARAKQPLNTPTPTPTEVSTKDSLNDYDGKETGKGFWKEKVTIPNRAERIARFEKKVAEALGREGWHAVIAARDPTDPQHSAALELCKHAAAKMNKGWPTDWI